MKRPLLALFLSILLVMPMHNASAANFVEPMVKAWQMMDAMRQMMEWFIGGGSSNSFGNQRMPYGSPYPMPYATNRNPVSSNQTNPVARGRVAPGRVVEDPQSRDREWLRDPAFIEENFWGDDPYWDGLAVPLSENYPTSRTGYEGVDGLWVVNTGERWMIQGNRFILMRTNGIISKGEFTIKGDWIEVRHYDTNTMTLLQFRQMDDLLLIRDSSGAVALLRRLRNQPNQSNMGGYIQ